MHIHIHIHIHTHIHIHIRILYLPMYISYVFAGGLTMMGTTRMSGTQGGSKTGVPGGGRCRGASVLPQAGGQEQGPQEEDNRETRGATT